MYALVVKNVHARCPSTSTGTNLTCSYLNSFQMKVMNGKGLVTWWSGEIHWFGSLLLLVSGTQSYFSCSQFPIILQFSCSSIFISSDHEYHYGFGCPCQFQKLHTYWLGRKWKWMQLMNNGDRWNLVKTMYILKPYIFHVVSPWYCYVANLLHIFWTSIKFCGKW